MPEIMVKGMSCGHCAAAVTKALTSLPGISEVQVDLVPPFFIILVSPAVRH